MMTKRISSLILCIISAATISLAQSIYNPGRISGKVIDSVSKRPMEYANIVLLHAIDSSQVTGTVTDAGGYFELGSIPVGRYNLVISFIGYERYKIGNLQITETNPIIQLNDVFLAPAAILLQSVTVEGERAPLTYQIDKKVITPEHLNTAVAGSVVDILQNVPSISVDMEGNVSLRGRGNITVLIDGRPTIMDPQEALQQIPATSVESIEIITNPSAKFDPEGTAGIINIKLKKNISAGFSGMVNVNGGLNDKYGGDLLTQYKTPSYNLLLGLNYNNRSFSGTEREDRSYLYEGRSSFIRSSGDSKRGRRFGGVRGAIELNLTDRAHLALSGQYRDREWGNRAHLTHEEWTDTNPQRLYRTNMTDRSRGGSSSSLGLDYRQTFSSDRHALTASFQHEWDNSDERTLSELLQENTRASGRITTEDGPSSEFEARIEYVHPFSSSLTFEAGYQGEAEKSEENTGLHIFNPTLGIYENHPQFSHRVTYDENEHALYALTSGEWGNIGYQFGFRGEYTKRLTSLAKTGQSFLVDRWDYFPSFHTSYRFAKGKQLMASYTRRIDRPGGGQTEPFDTWIDANNVRRGNPSLLPEFIDSYELAAQTFIGSVTLSGELYYTVTQNKIQDVRQVYSENVTLRTPENIGRDKSLGAEFLVNFDAWNDWNVNIVGNVYDYRIEGTLFGEPFLRRSFNWRLRLNNTMTLGTTQIQFSARYESPSVSPQGRERESVVTDLALKREFLDRRLTAILHLNNILNAHREELTSTGPGFHTFSRSIREWPMVMLTLRLNLNRFDNDKERRQEETEGRDEEW
jgi:hypothetical protein